MENGISATDADLLIAVQVYEAAHKFAARSALVASTDWRLHQVFPRWTLATLI